MKYAKDKWTKTKEGNYRTLYYKVAHASLPTRKNIWELFYYDTTCLWVHMKYFDEAEQAMAYADNIEAKKKAKEKEKIKKKNHKKRVAIANKVNNVTKAKKKIDNAINQLNEACELLDTVKLKFKSNVIRRLITKLENIKNEISAKEGSYHKNE